jgi:hypothetical protein
MATVEDRAIWMVPTITADNDPFTESSPQPEPIMALSQQYIQVRTADNGWSLLHRPRIHRPRLHRNQNREWRFPPTMGPSWSRWMEIITAVPKSAVLGTAAVSQSVGKSGLQVDRV